MSHMAQEALKSPKGNVVIPPPAAVKSSRSDDTLQVDVECTLGECYLTIWSSSERNGRAEPAELTADNADAFARDIAERSALVRKLNQS